MKQYGFLPDNRNAALNTLAIDNPVEYARLYLDGTMQFGIDAEDST